MTKPVRVRFAPSPTGPLHIGGVRTALYNYLFARKHGGKFLLRIEDTDSNRFVQGAEAYIVEALKWCGIETDEGVEQGGPHAPYRQSERKAIYKQYAMQLVAQGNAYYAFDTPDELETLRKKLEAEKAANTSYSAQVRLGMKNSLSLSEIEVKQKLDANEPFVIRFKMPENDIVKAFDNIRGNVEFNTATLDDKVLYKSADGLPTYHLANVVDDRLMEITHVIRGEEWLPSLPLHVLLYRHLDWEAEMPSFSHLPLLLKPDGKGKLSKRDGDKMGFPVFPLLWTDPKTNEISTGYRESGYFPEAVVNLLAFLGWNPGTTKEIFTIDELVQAFSLEHVHKAGAKFDFEKAKWFNHQYLKAKTNTELANLFIPILNEKGINAQIQFVSQVCGLLKDRVNFVSEMWTQGAFFFEAPTVYDAEVIKKRWTSDMPNLLASVANLLTTMPNYNAESIKEALHSFIEENNANMGAVMNCLRLSLVGGSFGPDLPVICEMLGVNEVVSRINKAISSHLLYK